MNLVSTIESTEKLILALLDASASMEAAIEDRRLAAKARQAAQVAYDDAESEFVFEATMIDPLYAAAKNVPDRKVVMDKLLISARNGGPLRSAWAQRNEATDRYERADSHYAQIEQRSKTYRLVSELQRGVIDASRVAAELRINSESF